MPSRRGQTTLDFALGISIFLAVILFVFIFVPGLLDPFSLNDEEETVLAGQIADRLSQDQLGDPAEPYVLDRYCTVSFFDGDTPDRCRYEGDSLKEKLNVEPTTDINVTIERNTTVGSANPDTVCWNEDERNLTSRSNCDPGGADTLLTTGETPPQDESTITARRVVSLDDEDVTLKVVVW